MYLDPEDVSEEVKESVDPSSGTGFLIEIELKTSHRRKDHDSIRIESSTDHQKLRNCACFWWSVGDFFRKSHINSELFPFQRYDFTFKIVHEGGDCLFFFTRERVRASQGQDSCANVAHLRDEDGRVRSLTSPAA